MKQRRGIFLMVLLTISVAVLGSPSFSAPKKKSSTTTKPAVKPDNRLFNMCEVMDAIGIANLYPGKVLKPIVFLNEGNTGQPVEGAWRKRDLTDEAKFVTTVCYTVAGPVAHPEVQSDQLSISQDRPIPAAKKRQNEIKAESTKMTIEGIDGEAWVSRLFINARPDRFQEGCTIFVETKLGAFQVSNSIEGSTTTTSSVDQVSCDIATEMLKRVLAKVATGTVSKLPAPKR
jgi:hypothetical protein